MQIIINHSSMVPIYEQIIEQMKYLIQNNVLQAGTQLPSVRVLSKELRISALTVKKAYDSLEEEGYTATVHGKGTFVLEVKKGCLLEEARKELEEELDRWIAKGKSLGLSSEELRTILDVLLEE